MPKVIVLGGGIVGLSTGMLLADHGGQVTVLERDLAGEARARRLDVLGLMPPFIRLGLAGRIRSVAAEHEEFLIPGPTRADLLGNLA